jgi:hypothetical protein
MSPVDRNLRILQVLAWTFCDPERVLCFVKPMNAWVPGLNLVLKFIVVYGRHLRPSVKNELVSFVLHYSLFGFDCYVPRFSACLLGQPKEAGQ